PARNASPVSSSASMPAARCPAGHAGPAAQTDLRRGHPRFGGAQRRQLMAEQPRSRAAAGAQELVFMALGGIGEIGMNCYLYGLGPAEMRQWLMIDLGITFPEGENDPGIDVILPDLRFIEEERGALAGLVLTHAHEDPLGAVVHL